MKYVKNRESLLQLIPKNLVCVELGVLSGSFSEKILKYLEPSELYLVDHFTGLILSGDHNGENVKEYDMNFEYEELQKFYKNHRIVKFKKCYSKDALKEFSDNYLDFVYIDTDHTFNTTFEELELSFHKLKDGGFLCGHDYSEIHFPECKMAVDLFCSTYNQKIEYLTTEDVMPSFLIKLKKSAIDFPKVDFIDNLNDVSVEFYINSKIKRYDIINFLIDRYNLKEYLEIGVFKGENIRMINVVNKHGVDPGAENQIDPEVTHVMTSDVFFNQIDIDKKYDIVFIDGLHEYSQVKKDIQNSFKHLSKYGFIVLHDCNPVSYESQYPIRKTMAWTGDVWKAFVEFKNNNPHHYSCVIDTDFGVGVIKNNHNIEPIFDNTIDIDYFKFISDKNKYLNLINWETFKIFVDNNFNHKKYNKIFQIGFNKCGTTSLHQMFIESGLKSVHWDGGNIAKKIDSNIKQNKPPLNGVDKYDCYTDIENIDTNSFPFIKYYELLDKAYPNSLFILNTRPLDNWIKSRLNHGRGSYANTFKKVLGVDTTEELVKIWTEQCTEHHKKAIDYFKNRDNFIIFDIETEGDKLTEFLRGWSIPVIEFPHSHKSF